MINKVYFEEAAKVAELKGISIEDVYETLEKSLQNAYKKTYGNSSCRVVVNPDRNEILLYGVYKVVEELTVKSAPVEGEEPVEAVEAVEDTIAEMTLEEAKKIKASYKVGDIVEININIKNMNATAARAAKSVTVQGIKTKEREKAYEYFKSMENEMVIAEVNTINEKYINLKLQYGVPTSISVNELLPNDSLVEGDKIPVYIKKVEQTNKEPKVIVSRTDRQLVIRVMESFIPEIADGTIEIMGIARDPGDRSKIALLSHDENIDAIGSCVGEKGLRSKEIVNALGGEKIDLYEWSEDPATLVSNALKPATVTKVLSVDPKTKSSVVVVPDDQLSLAIGKSGQNVRLAVQSCTWKIDIMPVSKAYEQGLIELFQGE